MTKLIKFDLEDGSKDFVYIEVDQKVSTSKPTPIDDRIGLRDGITQRATQSLGEALSVIRPVANAIVARVKSLSEPADEVTVKFAIKMSAEIGAIVASGNTEANYEITLKWSKKE